MNKSLSELQQEFNNLPEEELNKLASKEDVRMTSSDEIFENNSYDVPRVVAIYWRPALNGNEVKVLDYLVYKTWGFNRVDGRRIDAVSFSQIVGGTVGQYEGKEIRYDYGAGVSKKGAALALKMLEFLDILEVIRESDKMRGSKTNKYRIKTAEEWSNLSVNQKKVFMLEDPFVKVDRARKFLKSKGLIG